MRVAIGGIEHETNTYATSSMGPTTLQRFATLRGEEFARTAGTRTTLGGFADAAERIGCELVPTLWAMAGPSGTIERATYDALRSELLDRLSDAGPVDAVVLSLHGAGVVDGVDDLESDLVVGVRTVVGEIPIVNILFSSRSNQTTQSNLIFFITPKIMDPTRGRRRLITPVAPETDEDDEILGTEEKNR